MHIDPESGLLAEARQVSSPNADGRPDANDIDLVVVHSISLPPGEYGEDWIERFFCNDLPASEHPYFEEICEMQVSAHLLIKRDGDIIQFVPFHQRAWHAGESAFDGRERCNDFSIGIELEGTDEATFEDAQYRQLAAVIVGLQQAYPAIVDERITGHSDIAPGRKTDPGSGFDWDYLRSLLSELGQANAV